MTNNEIIRDLKDPDGWTVENNPHPAPDYVRSYPNKKNGYYWTDYMEYYGNGEYICHQCIVRAKYGDGNCIDGGDYFQCVKSGRREELRRKYTMKKDVQTTLM